MEPEAKKGLKTKAKANGFVVKARCSKELKLRATKYRTRRGVKKSEGWLVRTSLEEFLDARAPSRPGSGSQGAENQMN